SAREQRDWNAAYAAGQDLLRFRQRIGSSDPFIFSAIAFLAEIAIWLGNMADAINHMRAAQALLHDSIEGLNIGFWWTVTEMYFAQIGDYKRAILVCSKLCHDLPLDSPQDYSVLE